MPKRTVLTCLTPPGTGAIATLALAGEGAWAVLERFFQLASGKPVAEFLARLRERGPAGRFWCGLLGDPARGRDEVVLALRAIEPIPILEIHCHGGREVIALLQDTLATAGVELCAWDEWLSWTAPPRWMAEVQKLLAQAPTTRTAGILLDQYQGAFQRELARLGDLSDALLLEHLERLAALVPLARHLTIPWRVAFAGPPNVGKSSLINALAGYQRCIVSPTPGTTRDVVGTLVAIDGWPTELLDTAGLRRPEESLEEAGMALAREVSQKADVCLWVLDVSGPPGWPSWAREEMPGLRLVLNKVDLPPTWAQEAVPDALGVSAVTGTGLDALCSALSRWLVPQLPQPGEPVPALPEEQTLVVELLALCQAHRFTEVRAKLETCLAPF